MPMWRHVTLKKHQEHRKHLPEMCKHLWPSMRCWEILHSFFSFNFMSDFPLGKVAGQMPSEEWEYLTVNNNLSRSKFYPFIHFHAHFSSREGRGGSSPGRARNTSRSTSVSGNTAGSTKRWGQVRSKM